MRHQSLNRSKTPRRGATVVEFAVIAPVFLLMVFSIIEVSRAVMLQQALTDAARAAARKAALASTSNVSAAESSARNYLRQAMTSSFNMSLCQVNISPGSDLGDLAVGSDVTATVSVNYNDVSWVVPSFMNSIVLKGNATMTKE